MLQHGSIQLVGPFRLHVVLKQGRDLAAKDSCGRANVVPAKHWEPSKTDNKKYCIDYWNSGTSDPYVKFKLGNKVIYRSKTIHRDLNPIWEEDFDIHLDDLNTPLHIRVMI
jgi:hypothetical protein